MNYNMWSHAITRKGPILSEETKDLEDHMKLIEDHVKPYKSSYRFLLDTIYSTQRGFG